MSQDSEPVVRDICIVTNAVYKEAPRYLEHTDELKRRYAERHGMNYNRLAHHPHPGMHGVFCKFWAIRSSFDVATDWVVWMDCDAAPVTMDADLRAWLKGKPKKVIMLKDALGWNAGVFAVPNCRRAIEWLAWLEDMDNMRRFDRGYRDQDEMAWTFANNFRDFILEDGYDFGLNNYDDIYPHKAKPNLFAEGRSWCLHIPGYSNGYREARFGNILRRMDGEPEAFVPVKVNKNGLGGPTVQDYINRGAKSVLIDYPHGLGDVLMFFPFYQHLEVLNHGVTIDLKMTDALQPLHPLEHKGPYDVEIYFPARFNERDPALAGMTKPECNVKYDLGIPYESNREYEIPLVFPTECRKESPFVGVNYCCSCYPLEGNCPERTARMVWDSVVEAGFVPIEVFFAKNGRKENYRYPFVTNTMRNFGGIMRMMSVLASLRGVASVSTGTFHYGMAAYPETTLYLQNGFKASSYTRKKVLTLDVNNPDPKVLREWTDRLRSTENE